MEKLTANSQLINIFARKRQLRLLAYYYFFKSRYKNGTFYNYSIKSMSQKAGVNRSVIRTWLDQLVRAGLARKHKKNITLISWRTVHKSYNCKGRHNIKITLGTLPKILRQLEYLHLEFKLKQQEYILALKRTLTNVKGVETLKKVKKKLKRFDQSTSESETFPNDKVRLSLSKIGDHFSCSKSNAQRLIWLMQLNGFLLVKRGKWKAQKAVKSKYCVEGVKRQIPLNEVVKAGMFRHPANVYLIKGIA